MGGLGLKEIGAKHGVSKQRIYQILTKFGVETPQRSRGNFLRGKPPKYYWLNKMLCIKGFSVEDRRRLLDTMNPPDYCPMLGIRLNYGGTGEIRKRSDDSPSVDRIDSRKGYTSDNIHIISWRANRIKNDSTPEELVKIANYFINYQKIA
jgi:hypothetical protein